VSTGANSVKNTAKASTGSTASTASTTTTTKPTAAQIQQAQVQVDEAKATVSADEKAVKETKLYAPASGTIASLSSDSIGQTIASASSSSSAASQSAASGSSTGATGGSSTSNSSSGFAELINDKTMTMTVSLSEDDISNVKVGQTATVSITALSGVELAGRVSSISPLGTDSSGVVSYNATVTVTQGNSKVFPGMSATAAIVTGQAQGVTVPNNAITGAGTDASV
jgi:multidrug resistance efflux pump